MNKKIIPWIGGMAAIGLLFLNYYTKNTNAEEEQIKQRLKRSQTLIERTESVKSDSLTAGNENSPAIKGQSPPVSGQSPSKVVYVINSCNGVLASANVRSSPSYDAPIIGVLETGEGFTPERNQDEWIQFSTETHKAGWIHACFVYGARVTGYTQPTNPPTDQPTNPPQEEETKNNQTR